MALADLLIAEASPSGTGEARFPFEVLSVENHLGVPTLAALTNTWEDNKVWVQDLDEDVLISKLPADLSGDKAKAIIPLDPFCPSLRLGPHQLQRLRSLAAWMLVDCGSDRDYAADLRSGLVRQGQQLGVTSPEPGGYEAEIWVMGRNFPALFACSAALASGSPDVLVVVGKGAVKTSEIKLLVPESVPIVTMPSLLSASAELGSGRSYSGHSQRFSTRGRALSRLVRLIEKALAVTEMNTPTKPLHVEDNGRKASSVDGTKSEGRIAGEVA